MSARRLGYVLAGLFLTAVPAVAQPHQFTLEASFIRGAIGYARPIADRVHGGVEVGFGFPQIDRTVHPEQDAAGDPDFEEYLHVALLARLAASPNVEVDAGIRGAIADLWPCDASDCWPAVFGGVYVQPMVGWRRVKLGVRLTAGWIGETEPPGRDGWTGVVGFSPFVLRLLLPW